MSHTTTLEAEQSDKATGYSVLTADRSADNSESLNSREPPTWPISPQPLRKSNLSILGEICLLTLPIAFLALAATAYTFHEQPVSEHGATLQRVMLLGPTLFPLAFAALGGRSLKNTALWSAERGSTVGALENLHGSQSFVSSIGLAVALRSFSFLSLSILLMWSLSTLGGQSSLRLLSKANAADVTSRPVFYPNQSATSYILGVNPTSALNGVSIIVSASISTADTLRNSSADTWNHPKIPRLPQVELSSLENDGLGHWVDVQNDSAHAYTSLTGLSVVGLQADTISNFTIPYEYMYADCKTHMRARAREVKSILETEFRPKSGSYQPQSGGWALGDGVEYSQLFNVSYMAPGSRVYYESSFFIVSPETDWTSTGYVYYGTKDLGLERISLYNCTLHDTELEANIVCNSAACHTTRLRRTSSSRPQTTSALYDELRNGAAQPWKLIQSSKYLQAFIGYFASIGGTVPYWSTHPIDNYVYADMSTTGAPRSYFDANPRLRDWSTIPDEQVSQRLTEIFNTYWEASRWMDTTSRADPFGVSSLNKTSNTPFEELRLIQTTASVTRQVPIYRASLPWILTLIFCSGVLFLLGLMNIFVTVQTAMPDILGAVSSLTRDNPHVVLPAGGSSLGGMERTRLIKDMKVQLCDVQAEEEVGRIGLRSIAKDDVVTRATLDRDRLYI